MAIEKFKGNYPTLFDRFTDNWFDWVNRNYFSENTTLPSVNIKESNDSFDLELAIPGFSKEDFKVEINGNTLTVSSEKKTESENKKDERFISREFSYQSFSRSFTLPDTVNKDNIMAKYDNGLLKVSIPKKEEIKDKSIRQIVIN